MIFYTLNGHEPVPIEDALEWAREFDCISRVVMQTKLIDGSMVSTVFLGIDHGWSKTPILFETALLTEDGCSVVDRYATWGEAEAGHIDWLDRCIAPERIAQ